MAQGMVECRVEGRVEGTVHDSGTVADFAYDTAHDGAGLPARVAVFGDRVAERERIARDLRDAGFRMVDGGALAALIEGPVALLGDIVMIDCPRVDAGTLAALARLDMRIAQAGAALIVSTSLDALDDVFAALDQSDPQILVSPGRADRVLAVGRILAELGSPRATDRVREITREDRLNLLQLSRQVEEIARQIEGLTGGEAGLPGSPGSTGDTDNIVTRITARRDGAYGSNGAGADTDGASGPAKSGASDASGGREALPDPRLVRRMIAARQARARFFAGDLFADPAWDMLLDLTAAEGEQQDVSVSSLCIAAGVPATTALRWLKQMVENGLFERIADPGDRRRAFIALSATSREAMARYFAEIEMPLARAA